MEDVKYSVSLELTHEFEIDIKGLIKWAKDNYDLDAVSWSEMSISFEKSTPLTPAPLETIGEGEDQYEIQNFKYIEQKALREYYETLTEEAEAVKLALPSRLQGLDLDEWEAAKKAEIAAITDFSQLTDAQKKLWMGLALTDEEKDGLGV